MGDIITEEEK